MGLSIDKVNPEKFSSTSDMEIINVNNAGTIYFVQHKVKGVSAIESMNDQLEKPSHYGIAVDITGISNNIYDYLPFLSLFQDRQMNDI